MRTIRGAAPPSRSRALVASLEPKLELLTVEVTAPMRTRTESDSHYDFMLERDEKVWRRGGRIWRIVGRRLGKIQGRVTPSCVVASTDWIGSAMLGVR